jgi:DNA processing protein
MSDSVPAWHAWLRLACTPGIGALTACRLLQHWGTPEALFGASSADLAEQVGPRLARAVLAPLPADWPVLLRLIEHWLQAPPDPKRAGISAGQRRILTWDDPHYPRVLLDTADPPLLLYAQGQVDALAATHAIGNVAMVGSRNPSTQGRISAQDMARDLAKAGYTIVSGLALGIDGAAHEGALQGHARSSAPALLSTVAVVGNGLDAVYPQQHRDLAEQIAHTGVLLSEYPPGTAPRAAHFPQRNRLIAALSQGVVVVQAAMQSGSLITARLALELGRDVMAMPGSVHAPHTRGCHALIRVGARLVENAQQVIEELQGDPITLRSIGQPRKKKTADATRQQAPAESGSAALFFAAGPADHEDTLFLALGHDPIDLDNLQLRTGWDTARLQAALVDQEMRGQIDRMPGGLWQRRGGG